jgi:hypothetical protein
MSKESKKDLDKRIDQVIEKAIAYTVSRLLTLYKNDLEKVGDIAENVYKLARQILDEQLIGLFAEIGRKPDMAQALDVRKRADQAFKIILMTMGKEIIDPAFAKAEKNLYKTKRDRKKKIDNID